MGIRVRKTLGYGLADVAVDGTRIADPRINSRSPVLACDDGGLESYLEFLDARAAAPGASRRDGSERHVLREAERARLDAPGRRRPAADPGRCVLHDGEYGLPNVLLLRPVWLSDWERHDDPIDWVEETWLRPDGQSQQPRVQVLRHGLYPFSATWMDDRTGERLGNEIMSWVRASSDERLAALRQADPAAADAVLDRLARDAGLSGHAEAAAHVVPHVPDDIRDLADWAELFTDPGTWRSLRPMLYVRWS